MACFWSRKSQYTGKKKKICSQVSRTRLKFESPFYFAHVCVYMLFLCCTDLSFFFMIFFFFIKKKYKKDCRLSGGIFFITARWWLRSKMSSEGDRNFQWFQDLLWVHKTFSKRDYRLYGLSNVSLGLFFQRQCWQYGEGSPKYQLKGLKVYCNQRKDPTDRWLFYLPLRL